MEAPDTQSFSIRFILLGILLQLTSLATAQAMDLSDWQSLERQARGETVYFNAWGGEPRTNNYLNWVSELMLERYDITVQHVKVSDTAEAVSKVVAQRQAGNDDNGSIDLLWINGENFAALKENDLLYGPWAESLPNFKLVNADRFPEMREDFTVPTQGFESPWTRSQLVFYYDTQWLAEPPQDIAPNSGMVNREPWGVHLPSPTCILGQHFSEAGTY